MDKHQPPRKYRCHNRPPFQTWVDVQQGWQNQPLGVEGETRIPLMGVIDFRMAHDCQYTLTALGQADQGCEGCRWRRTPP